MNRYTLGLFLFFLATLPVAGQATYPLIEGPPPAKLAEASAMVENVKKSQSPVALSIGGYALIQIKVTTKLTPYVVPGSNDCLDTEMIPKGQVKKVWGIKDGGKEWVRITIPADPDYDRLYVTGTIKGAATILWLTVVNGEAVVIAGYQFDVAGGKPKPVDPIDPIPDSSDALVIAATADVKAGKGTADDVDAYSSLFLMYGTQVKNGSSLTTFGELNKEMNSNIDRLLGSDIEKCLPSLRKAVGKELVAKIPTITNANGKIADVRELLSAELLSISKRLQGVK